MTKKHRDLTWAEGEALTDSCDQEILDANAFEITGLFIKTAQVVGQCPYCRGDVRIEKPLRLLPASPQSPTGQGISRRSIDVTVRCNCSMVHDGRPTGEVGCGRSWVATGVK